MAVLCGQPRVASVCWPGCLGGVEVAVVGVVVADGDVAFSMPLHDAGPLA